MGIAHFIWLSVAAAVFFGLRLVQRRRFYRNLPTPPHSFIWGHLKLFGEVIKQFPPDTSVHVFYTAIAQKYELRGIFYLDLWPFGPPQMILSTPETAEMVTVNSNYPMHDEVARFLGPLVGYKAIGSSDGPMWKMLHRMMAPSFRPSVITSMVPTIATQTMQVFHSKLAQFASDGETFSMQKLAGRLIFRISSKVFLGVALSDQMNEDLLHDMDQIMDYAQMLTLTSGTSPLKKAVKWWRKRMAARRIDTFLLSLIEKRQVALSRGGPESPAGEVDVSTLDRLLLEGQKMEIGSQRPGKPSEALVPLIVDNLKGLLFGGYGTTTDTLCFIFILLSVHPSVVEKLRQEHSQVFSEDIVKTQQILHESPHKTNELKYTNAVIKETLRLFPVGFGVRKAVPGVESLQYEGKSYPTSNQLIIPCTHTIHYDPEVFPMPSRFDPERFMEPSNVPRGAWRAFERGPRSCIGREMAMEVMRIALLLTLREFDFGCASVTRTDTPITSFTDLDMQIGDLAFQEQALSAKPRGGTMMKVTAV